MIRLAVVALALLAGCTPSHHMLYERVSATSGRASRSRDHVGLEDCGHGVLPGYHRVWVAGYAGSYEAQESGWCAACPVCNPDGYEAERARWLEFAGLEWQENALDRWRDGTPLRLGGDVLTLSSDGTLRAE